MVSAVGKMSLASRLLPITRRGQFFEDDFFSGFQKDYSSAITDVLDRWGGRSLLADQFSNYRKARAEEPQNDDSSLAASISETPETYVIVLDMTDFVSGEITVRTTGLNAVVDAKVGTTRKFHRVYPLPKDINTDAVAAAMSDEGILTITAKRKVAAVKKIEAETSVDQSSTSAQPNFVSSLKIDVGQSEEGTGSQPSSPSATGQASSSSSTTQQTESMPSDAYKTLPISRRGQFFKDAFFENVWNDFDSAMGDMVSRQKQRQEKKQEERMKRETARKEVMQKMMQEEEEQIRRLRADRLERQRRASQEVQQQMNLFQVPSVDRFSSYRTLRNWAGGEDSQASTITADDKAYQVVLDVKDYADGDLDLKSDGEVLTVSGGKGGVTFKREFSLPGLDAPELVTASLSEDGVLTITAPKKSC